MKFTELLKQYPELDSVKVIFNGYTRKGSTQFEFFPERIYTFKINRDYNDLDHKWLLFQSINSEDFYIQDNQAFCKYPKLWALI